MKTCDICGRNCGTTHVDGKTKFGPWATMCISCHTQVGVGFGTGKGQEFESATMKKLQG